MVNPACCVAVVGTERSDAPFPFESYAAIASARDHLAPVTVHAEHLPYGVWWDRLRPTVTLAREPYAGGDTLPLDGAWGPDRRFLPRGSEEYDELASTYRVGDGLF